MPMKQRNLIVICAVLTGLTAGVYSWYTPPGTSGEALANAPLPAATGIRREPVRLLTAVPETSSPASSAPAKETIPASPPAEQASPETPSAPAATVPSERSETARKSGRGGSKRDD